MLQRSDRVDGVEMGQNEPARRIPVRPRTQDQPVPEPVSAWHALDRNRSPRHFGDDEVHHSVNPIWVMAWALDASPGRYSLNEVGLLWMRDFKRHGPTGRVGFVERVRPRGMW